MNLAPVRDRGPSFGMKRAVELYASLAVPRISSRRVLSSPSWAMSHTIVIRRVPGTADISRRLESARGVNAPLLFSCASTENNSS